MKERAFKVLALQKGKVVAEYVFDQLKSAIKFELGMRKKGYTTQVERVSV